MAQDEFDAILDGDDPDMNVEEAEEVVEVEDTEAEETAEEVDKEAEEEATEEEPESTEEPVTLEAVKAQLDAAEKEKHGLFNNLKTERTARQGLQRQVDEIRGMLQQARLNVQEKVDVGAEDAAQNVSLNDGKVIIQFDDNGVAYVDKKDLVGLTKSEITEVNERLQNVEDARVYNDLVAQNRSIINKALSADERYPVAYNQVSQAYAYIDQKAGEIMKEYGIEPGPGKIHEVIEYVERDFGQEFATKFPGFDIDLLVEAFIPDDNHLLIPRKINKVLKMAAASSAKAEDKIKTKNMKSVAGKPKSLHGASNQKGAVGKTLDDLADMSVESFEKMTDKELAQIERMLEAADG